MDEWIYEEIDVYVWMDGWIVLECVPVYDI